LMTALGLQLNSWGCRKWERRAKSEGWVKAGHNSWLFVLSWVPVTLMWSQHCEREARRFEDWYVVELA
jgi:hypothetical protein